MRTRTTRATGPRRGADGRVRHEVVAGLVNDGSAASVAQAAVLEALRIGGRVVFVHMGTDRPADADDDAGGQSATFRCALEALRRRPRPPSSFEAVRGDAVKGLVDRSRRASLLVLGEDRPAAADPVTVRCRQLAACDVLTVPRP